MRNRWVKSFIVFSVVFSMFISLSNVYIQAAGEPKLKEKKATLYVGQKGYTITVTGADKSAVIRFSSSDKTIVKVGKKNGKVTPLNEGKVKVTVKVKQNGKTYKLKATLTVKKAQANPGNDEKEKNKKATCAEFTVMMSDVIETCDASMLSKWKKIAKNALKSTAELKLADAELILYEAACVLGIGQGTVFWCDYVQAYGTYIWENKPVTDGLFENIQDISQFECFLNENAGYDYETAARDYSYGNSSPADSDSFFGREDIQADYERIISTQECENAAKRLIKAYECIHEGSFNIKDYETDWSDERLKEAYELKNAIINSKTEIVKSDNFEQGKTYTGTAYYVSNNGDDANDGLTPETAWKTLEKVTDTTLKFGDAVFFERGGRWYGRLMMQEGVTYSAYGEGNKPIWTGSPLDAPDSSKWEYYGETKDGGKIWKYNEKHTDCGIILLNEEIVCRKYYPVWNGKEYLTYDGKKKFNLKRELSADLMFYSDIDLTGYDVPCSPWSDMIEGDIYLRCDKGNPGDVFKSIEMGVSVDNITTAEGGYNTIDNICYRFMGLDCNCNDNIIIQNCEACWVGGSVQSYNYVNGKYITDISGGGMLLFGNNEIGRNNYIHDCESKGIAVVINGDGHHKTLSRKNIIAENNVVERCGMSLYMMTEFVQEGLTTVLEDVTYKDNYFIENSKGWRMHSQMWIGNGWGTYGDSSNGTRIQTIGKTGRVIIKNNLYYGSQGPLLCYMLEDEVADKVEYINNKYILPYGTVVYTSSMEDDDGVNEERFLAIGTRTQVEKSIRKIVGDTKAKFEFM